MPRLDDLGRIPKTLARSSRWVLVLACFLVWLTRMLLPGDQSYSHLDASWRLGIGYALEHGWRTGIDTIFTSGPLGIFATATYVPGLLWIKLFVWEGAFQLLAAVVLTMAGAGIRNRLLRVLWFLLIIACPLETDSHALLTIVAALAWIAQRRGSPVLPVVAAATVLAGLALVKFTFAVAACLCLLASAAILWRAASKRAAAGLVSGFLALTVIGWWLCGQSLLDFPAYVRSSMEISSAYSEAMSTDRPPDTLAVALPLLGLALFAACLHGRSRLFHAAVLWLGYKAGFVRAFDHTPIFFIFAALSPLLLDVAEGSTVRVQRLSAASRLACIALGVAGVMIAGRNPAPGIVEQDPHAFQRVAAHARAVFRPDELRARAEKALYGEDARWFGQPRLRQVVGSSPIDMVTSLQVVLFRNGLAWRPRPVFQSYATLTPGLQDLNARFLEGDSAPEFILFYLFAIDSRLATLEDATALQVIARDYEPVLRVGGLLLLRRNPRSGPADSSEPLLRKTVRFEETVELGELAGSCHLLALDIRYTLAGRLLTLLDAAPPLFLEVETDGGETLPLRIVPGMIRNGAILDPLIQNQRDWIAWCTGRGLPRPVRFRVVPAPRPWMYEPEIEVRITRADGIAPRPRPNLDFELAFSVFPTLPARVASSRPPDLAVLLGREFVALPITSELEFAVPAGRRRLTGILGVSLAPPPGCASEGILFRAVLAQPGRPDRILFERHVDPRHVAEHRRLFSFDVPFDTELPGRLLLRTEPANRSDPGCDFACWTDITVK